MTIDTQNILKSLEGKKTYIVGVLLVADALYFLLTGDRLITHNATLDNPSAGGDAVLQLLNGSGLMTLRSAISGMKKDSPGE